MKRTVLSRALLIAGMTTLSIPLSFAADAEKTTSDFEFHGYFRTGAFSSSENDFNQAIFYGQKETLGRLGLEGDDFFELAFVQRWDWNDGRSIRINARLGQDNPQGGVSTMGGLSIDGKSTGFIEGYVEFDGITETGTMWGGQRYYGRDNYIFMTDFFYTDYSGTGLGVQNVELGNGQWDFAYIASNQGVNSDIFDTENNNGILHAGHVRADYGKWRMEMIYKHLPQNFHGDDYSTSGVEGHIAYTPENFFGMGNGFSTVSVQAGQGLGSGTMIGRTFTNYNAYSPGGAGNHADMTKVQDGDVTMRAQAYGGLFAGDWLFFPAVGYEVTSFDDSSKEDSSYWYAMVRPVYTVPSVDNFSIATEFGITDQDDNDGDAQYKATVSPTWSIATGFGPAPEIRLLATYISDAAGDDDIVVGAQVDMWW